MDNAPDEEDFDGDLGHDQRSLEDNRCSKCNEIKPKATLIVCARCCSRYHITCVKVKRKQAKEMRIYTCQTCRNITPHNNAASNAEPETTTSFDILQHLQTCKSNISLLGNIPRGARITAAEALNKLITDVIQHNTSLSWWKLLCFTYHGLQKPKKEKPTPNSPSLNFHLN